MNKLLVQSFDFHPVDANEVKPLTLDVRFIVPINPATTEPKELADTFSQIIKYLCAGDISLVKNYGEEVCFWCGLKNKPERVTCEGCGGNL